MAVIGSIRKQSGLLIILIGVAMVLFLLGDLFSGRGRFFSQQDTEIGTIRGEAITQQDFEQLVQQQIDAQYGAEGADEQVRKGMRERVWQQLLQDKLLHVEYNKLGISVSPEELLDQVKNTQPGSILYQYFTDPRTGQVIEQFRDPQTGGLNSQRVLQAIQSLLNSENSKDWLPIEAAIKEDILMNKYVALISKGITATSFEANNMFEEKNKNVTFSYVVKEFSSVPDEEIEVTDQDLQAYYNEHKHEKKYQQEQESRDIKYIAIDVTPSPEDVEEIRTEMEGIKSEFMTDTNDSAFVAENAEGQLTSLIGYYPESQLNIAIKDTMAHAPVGTVVGPYSANGVMMVSKLIKIEQSPDSVMASHILISVQDGDSAKIEAAKAKLDSLKNVAKAKKNFAELAKEYSEDFGSAEKGGDLGWFTRGRMVPPFEKAAFEGKVGDMPIVVSQFGVHLIYITDQTKPRNRYLIASVDRVIEPSKATSDEGYKMASRISIERNTLDKFDVTDEEPQPQSVEGLRLEDDNVGPLGPSREIVRWAYDAEVGDVSSPFELENRFVVVALTGIHEKGTMTFETAKPLIRPEVIKQKKADRFIEELDSYSSLEDAASKIGTSIQRAQDVRFANNALPGGLGREPELVGSVFSLDQGETSKPIIGNRGVFVARVDVVNDAPQDRDLAIEKREVSGTLAGRVDRTVFEALKKEAGVEDYRGRYY